MADREESSEEGEDMKREKEREEREKYGESEREAFLHMPQLLSRTRRASQSALALQAGRGAAGQCKAMLDTDPTVSYFYWFPSLLPHLAALMNLLTAQGKKKRPDGKKYIIFSPSAHCFSTRLKLSV